MNNYILYKSIYEQFKYGIVLRLNRKNYILENYNKEEVTDLKFADLLFYICRINDIFFEKLYDEYSKHVYYHLASLHRDKKETLNIHKDTNELNEEDINNVTDEYLYVIERLADLSSELYTNLKFVTPCDNIILSETIINVLVTLFVSDFVHIYSLRAFELSHIYFNSDYSRLPLLYKKDIRLTIKQYLIQKKEHDVDLSFANTLMSEISNIPYMISPQLVNNTMQTKAHIHNSNELLSCELLNITTGKSYIRNFCKCIICKNIMYRTKAHKKHYCNFVNEKFILKNEFTLASDRVNCTENDTTVTNNTTKQSNITTCAKLYKKHFQEPRDIYSKKLSNHQYKATDKDAYNIDNISTEITKDDFNSKANELENQFYDDINISEYKNKLETIYNKFK